MNRFYVLLAWPLLGGMDLGHHVLNNLFLHILDSSHMILGSSLNEVLANLDFLLETFHHYVTITFVVQNDISLNQVLLKQQEA